MKLLGYIVLDGVKVRIEILIDALCKVLTGSGMHFTVDDSDNNEGLGQKPEENQNMEDEKRKIKYKINYCVSRYAYKSRIFTEEKWTVFHEEGSHQCQR